MPDHEDMPQMIYWCEPDHHSVARGSWVNSRLSSVPRHCGLTSCLRLCCDSNKYCKHITNVSFQRHSVAKKCDGTAIEILVRMYNIITKVRDIIKEIKTKKWRWAGHLARQCTNRWTLKVTNWTPRTCVRRRGRQSRRWSDELRDHAGVTWQMKAHQNRLRWKIDEEAFLLQWREIG